MDYPFTVREALNRFSVAVRTFSCDSEDGYFGHLGGKDDTYASRFTLEELVATGRLIENHLTRMRDPKDRYAFVQELKRTRFVLEFIDPDLALVWPADTSEDEAAIAEETLRTFRIWFEAVARRCSVDLLESANREKEALLREITTGYQDDGPWSPKTLIEQ